MKVDAVSATDVYNGVEMVPGTIVQNVKDALNLKPDTKASADGTNIGFTVTPSNTFTTLDTKAARIKVTVFGNVIKYFKITVVKGVVNTADVKITQGETEVQDSGKVTTAIGEPVELKVAPKGSAKWPKGLSWKVTRKPTNATEADYVIKDDTITVTSSVAGNYTVKPYKLGLDGSAAEITGFNGITIEVKQLPTDANAASITYQYMAGAGKAVGEPTSKVPADPGYVELGVKERLKVTVEFSGNVHTNNIEWSCSDDASEVITYSSKTGRSIEIVGNTPVGGQVVLTAKTTPAEGEPIVLGELNLLVVGESYEPVLMEVTKGNLPSGTLANFSGELKQSNKAGTILYMDAGEGASATWTLKSMNENYVKVDLTKATGGSAKNSWTIVPGDGTSTGDVGKKTTLVLENTDLGVRLQYVVELT